MLRVRAGRVYPVTAPPIEDGAVLVGDDGTIVMVGPHHIVPEPAAGESLTFSDAVLTPGLVNVHTHLELTHLAGRVNEPAFAQWIRRIRELKDESTPEQFADAAEQGLRDCWRRGVTCVADTGSTGVVAETLFRLNGRGVAFHEVFGPDPRHSAESMKQLESHVKQLKAFVTPEVRLGVSPHAPYSVSEVLYRRVVHFAGREKLPVAIHLAESKEETELVRYGAGPFAERLRERGIVVEAHHASPVAYLRELGVLRSGTLCIHCVQVSDADIAILKEAGVTVAHCPRSNHAHAHGTAPLAAMRAAGLAVGLGTDSVVSVRELDPWAEAVAAGLEAEDALAMLTIEGARTLGWQRAIGSLEVGKAGDLAVFASPPPVQLRPVASAVLTVIGGRVVHR
jgi:5-methylthioadenosine/S-adenosylhomocysteine deaminase